MTQKSTLTQPHWCLLSLDEPPSSGANGLRRLEGDGGEGDDESEGVCALGGGSRGQASQWHSQSTEHAGSCGVALLSLSPLCGPFPYQLWDEARFGRDKIKK